MGSSISEVHWDVANCFRLLTVLVYAALTLEMVLMISHYWWRIIPLRKSGMRILTPPIRWTFAYHIVVASMVATTCISVMQRISFKEHTPATLSTWISGPLGIAMMVVVHEFVQFYSRDINQLEEEMIRQQEEYEYHLHRK
jgi:hypothetical protein